MMTECKSGGCGAESKLAGIPIGESLLRIEDKETRPTSFDALSLVSETQMESTGDTRNVRGELQRGVPLILLPPRPSMVREIVPNLPLPIAA